MKRARKYIRIREKWAAALAELLDQETRTALRKQKVPAKKVIAMFDQDHNILHALEGEDRWWNLTPLLRPEHREKAKKDTSIVAKVRRNARAETEHQEAMRRKMLAPTERPPEKRSKWPQGRKLQSRGFR